MAAGKASYFEMTYVGPWKGTDVSMPETMIDPASTPYAENWIPRSGELRTRPQRRVFLPGLPDNSIITGQCPFADANNVVHSCVTSTSGLWQLNSQWRNYPGKTWSNVGFYLRNDIPAPNTPVQFQVFVNSLFYVDGSTNLWFWNGVTPNSISSQPALQSVAQYDTTNLLNAGGYFLGELNSYIIILNTVEQVQPVAGPTLPKYPSNFPQRLRWSAPGLPFTWDPTVNTGAGYIDELDVPDTITGFMAIGSNGFIFRVNGISELTSISGGVLPWDINHLWASQRGIGSVYPWSIANYGPIGIFIATDDVYELSLGGFKKIGGRSRNAIFHDIGMAVSAPTASIFPAWSATYPYVTYMLEIVLAGGIVHDWLYFVEDDCWMLWPYSNGYFTGKVMLMPTI